MIERIADAVAQSKAVHRIVIEEGALERVPALLKEHYGSRQAFLIADENTMAAAGSHLQGILSAAGVTSRCHVFPGKPMLKPTVEHGASFLHQLQASGSVPIAVGSGVINDLTKWAAFQVGQPYLSVATAASMDGYASAGSPLSQEGFKHTITCAPPRVIVADPQIIAAAPRAMSAWGYGDLAGKIPAGADWIIADALGIEAIDAAAWAMAQQDLPVWLENPAGVAAGDAGAIMGLFTGLVLTGIAMEIHNSSRPASGADHQVAHMWEMDHLTCNGLPVSHGTCVSLGTLTVLSLYEWLLARDLQAINIEEVVARRRRLPELTEEIDRTFAQPEVARRALVEVEAKFVDDDGLRRRLERICASWPSLRQRLGEYLYPFERMRAMLATAGVETEPADVGISRDYHRRTLVAARLIRRRYTILDILEETGRIDEAVTDIFAPGGRWGA